jgi:cobaltochelatase CobN
MREFLEYLWGWDATVTETIDDAMWQETYEVYVKDKHELELKRFFDEKSPFAYQDMTARMIETVRKNYWQADADTLATLVTEYVESVERHGVGCSDNTCGNPRLLEYVLEQAAVARVPAPALEAVKAALEQAMGAPIAELAAAAREFAQANDAQLAARQVPGAEAVAPTESVDAAELRGFKLENVERPEQEQRSREAAPPPTSATSREWETLALAALVLGVLLLWRSRRRMS